MQFFTPHYLTLFDGRRKNIISSSIANTKNEKKKTKMFINSIGIHSLAKRFRLDVLLRYR
jgi:hypothetical protein